MAMTNRQGCSWEWNVSLVTNTCDCVFDGKL